MLTEKNPSMIRLHNFTFMLKTLSETESGRNEERSHVRHSLFQYVKMLDSVIGTTITRVHDVDHETQLGFTNTEIRLSHGLGLAAKMTAAPDETASTAEEAAAEAAPWWRIRLSPLIGC